jgi:hypothetical protein
MMTSKVKESMWNKLQIVQIFKLNYGSAPNHWRPVELAALWTFLPLAFDSELLLPNGPVTHV